MLHYRSSFLRSSRLAMVRTLSVGNQVAKRTVNYGAVLNFEQRTTATSSTEKIPELVVHEYSGDKCF